MTIKLEAESYCVCVEPDFLMIQHRICSVLYVYLHTVQQVTT